MNRRLTLLTLLITACVLSPGWAQRQGRFGGGRGGPGGAPGVFDPLMLLDVEAVQTDLELLDEQIADIKDLADKLRGPRQRGDRPNFREMSAEEREEFMDQRRKEAADVARQAQQELKNILLDDQMARLQQIYVQVSGTQALSDPEIAAKVGLSTDQQAKIATTRQDAADQMRELFASGDRQTMREKMGELQSQTNEKILGLLTDDQRQQLDLLKGTPFEMPEGALFGGRRGRDRTDGQQGTRRDRRNRPQRPE